MIRSTLSRLVGRIWPKPGSSANEGSYLVQQRPPEPTPTAPAPAAGSEDAVDPFKLGITDARLSGWYNFEGGELAPGFSVLPGDTVVDVGCGDGGMSKFCVQLLGAHAILIDHDAAVLEKAVRVVAGAGPGKVEGHVADVCALPLADASASRVICTEVLEHVDDPARLIQELVRIGRPGALYLLSVPGAASEHLQKDVALKSYFEKPNHVRILEPEEFIRLIENAGLVIERRSSYGFFWTMYWLLFWQAGFPFGQGSNPLLDAWTRTWDEVLKSRDGAIIQAALNGLAPKVNAVVARKAG